MVTLQDHNMIWMNCIIQLNMQVMQLDLFDSFDELDTTIGIFFKLILITITIY